MATGTTEDGHKHVMGRWMNQTPRRGKNKPTEYRVCLVERGNKGRCPHFETREKTEA